MLGHPKFKQMVYEAQRAFTSGRVEVNLTDAVPGIYLVRIHDDGEETVFRIVVEK